MNAEVLKVRTTSDESYEVEFSCDSGRGLARWADGSEGPVVGRSYSAELDLEDALELGANAELVDAVDGRLAFRGRVVTIIGLVESRDQDGMIYLRLAPDCLTMVETSGGGAPVGRWVAIQMDAASISIWPQGL